MAKLKVHVRQDLCTGEAVCTGICPRYYELITTREGEHKAMMKGPDGKLNPEALLDVDEDDYDEVLEAAERCPPKAIFVYEVDEDGEESQICP